ncbi:MAG TPA: PD-(D/E)XK nuclease family protein [Mycobacteriales bacterium]|nr:PD-(D/E)XK nuclease family protein [Mycobacteriales bacterium]
MSEMREPIAATAVIDLTSAPSSPPAEPTWSLSPSRALDFKNCALLYRFRVIDRLPEPPSLDAARGTVIHGVLERLFDRPAAERTSEAARSDVEPGWLAVLEEDPELAAMVENEPGGLTELIASTRTLLDSYFTLEDPRRIEPAEREVLVEMTTPTGVHLKGFIDRVDRSPAGDIRVVDYKSGKAPSEAFEGKALFQLRFYALVLWRTTGVLPRLLRLYYLRDREILDYAPDAADLESLERQVEAIAAAIQKARSTGDWRHKPSKLCSWCSFQSLCPEFGGTPPALPDLPTSSNSESTVSSVRLETSTLPGAGSIGTSHGTATTLQPADSAEVTPLIASSSTTAS